MNLSNIENTAASKKVHPGHARIWFRGGLSGVGSHLPERSCFLTSFRLQLTVFFKILVIIIACRQSKSHLLVSNPLPAENDPRFNSVVKLVIQNSEGSDLGICTGIFIRNNLLITAAHCVFDDKTKSLASNTFYVTKDGTRYRGEVFPLNEYDPNLSTKERIPNDLALVRFDQKDFAAPGIANFSKKLPSPGEKVVFVGYGKTDYDEPGRFNTKKSMGFNSLKKLPDDLASEVYRFQGVIDIEPEGLEEGQESLPLHGDSGGGVFRTIKNEKDVELIGITIAGVKKRRFSEAYQGRMGEGIVTMIPHPRTARKLEQLLNRACNLTKDKCSCSIQ